MQDIYKNLKLLEDEQDEQEKDIIFDELHSLTHIYEDNEDEGTIEVPWYCFLESIAGDFGYDYQEMINLVKSSPDYIVFKIHPVGSFEGATCIGAKDVNLDMVKEDIKKMCEDDFGDEDVNVKISLQESKLDDLHILKYKYCVEVRDRDDNLIERKFFMSRPQVDKYVEDNYIDVLFDERIDNNELIELENGKDFIGTLVKVIIETKKDESLNESTEETVEETDEYKIVKDIQHNFKTVNGVAKKGKDKEVYQVYFRTQDYNPSTNRWMNSGWSISTSDFNTLEDARAFVKKYGKKLKAEESLKKLGFEIKLNESCDTISAITKEASQNSDSFNDYVDRIEEALENFREREGYPCIFSVGLQNDGHIICDVEIKNESLKEEKNDYQKKFDERTKAHIDRVNKYAKKIGREYPNHDSDKFNELYDGYSLMSKDNVSEEEQALIDDATFRHVRDNEHHCEHWVDEKDIEGFSRNNPTPHGCLDCSKMPNEALEEMCCDWCAMSEEFNNTPFEWYEKNKDTRWHFNEEQDKFIQDTLHKLWDEELEEGLERKFSQDQLKRLEEVVNDSNLKFTSATIDEDNVHIKASVRDYSHDEYGDDDVIHYYKKADFDDGEWEYILNGNIKEDIEKHDTLNQKLFDGEELKPEVVEAIKNIANEFVKELGEDGISFTLKDIILLGSNMSYNYTKDSDLDIHLIADSNALECPKELQDKLYGAYRTIFNKNYDITLKGIPAEVYVELDEPRAKSNGIYSLNNGWVKKPEQQAIPELDKEAFDEFFKFWEDRYNELVNNENATSEDVEEYINDIYDERKDGIANDGEYSLGNLLFKEVRNKGYLDNLKELRKELKGKELSLEHLEEELDTSKYNSIEALNQLSGQVKEDGTYSIDKDGNLKKEDLSSGFMVSFFRPEITSEDLKDVLDTIGNRLGEPYLGRYGSPEISYCLSDINVARKLAKIFNQESIWNNSKGKDGYIHNRLFDSSKKVNYKKAVEELKKLLNIDNNKGIIKDDTTKENQ